MLNFLTFCYFDPYQSNVLLNSTAGTAVLATMSSSNWHVPLQSLMLVFL